jgi:hypothetical protein
MWYGYMRQKATKELITLKLLIMPLACLMYSVKKLSDENSDCWTSLKDLRTGVTVGIPEFLTDVLLSSIPKRSLRKLDLFSLQR